MVGPKNVIFDCVGTLVSYDHLFESMEARLGPKLKELGIQPKLLGCLWIETAEREYTYLSLSGRYRTFFSIMEALFYRMLWYAGVAKPREFASADDVKYLIGEWKKLKMRDGAKECVQKLRDAGFTVWGFTAGDLERVGGYFRQAGIEMPAENLLSCDSVGLAKPIPEAYKPVFEKFAGTEPWFAAAHMWDVSTARTIGFKGAYSYILEGEPLHDIFGEMEVVAADLPAMADGIIAAQAKTS